LAVSVQAGEGHREALAGTELADQNVRSGAVWNRRHVLVEGAPGRDLHAFLAAQAVGDVHVLDVDVGDALDVRSNIGRPQAGSPSLGGGVADRHRRSGLDSCVVNWRRALPHRTCSPVLPLEGQLSCWLQETPR
jgi:hypothetical protein